METLQVEREDWYIDFIGELKDMIVEKEFNSRWDIVECRHLIGVRILEENDRLDRDKIYGEKIVQRIAKSLGKSHRTISYAIQFAKKFPDLNLLPEGKDINWSRVVRKYLTPPKEDLVYELPSVEVLASLIVEKAQELSEGAKVSGNRIVLKMPISWIVDNYSK